MKDWIQMKIKLMKMSYVLQLLIGLQHQHRRLNHLCCKSYNTNFFEMHAFTFTFQCFNLCRSNPFISLWPSHNQLMSSWTIVIMILMLEPSIASVGPLETLAGQPPVAPSSIPSYHRVHIIFLDIQRSATHWHPQVLFVIDSIELRAQTWYSDLCSTVSIQL